jgi:hypothetical protein
MKTCELEIMKDYEAYLLSKGAMQSMKQYSETIRHADAIKFAQQYSDNKNALESAYHISLFHCTCGKCIHFFNENFK